MAYKTALLFTETHAVLQKKNGLGDCEPQTVVMSAVVVHKVKNRMMLRMAAICSTTGSTERSSVLEMNCTPAHQIQSQLFCYSSTPLADLKSIGSSTASQYSILLFFGHPWRIRAAETLRVLYCLLQNCFWNHACIELHTIHKMAMFSLMQTYKVYIFFVLQGDEHIMQHHFWQ